MNATATQVLIKTRRVDGRFHPVRVSGNDLTVEVGTVAGEGVITKITCAGRQIYPVPRPEPRPDP